MRHHAELPLVDPKRVVLIGILTGLQREHPDVDPGGRVDREVGSLLVRPDSVGSDASWG